MYLNDQNRNQNLCLPLPLSLFNSIYIFVFVPTLIRWPLPISRPRFIPQSLFFFLIPDTDTSWYIHLHSMVRLHIPDANHGAGIFTYSTLGSFLRDKCWYSSTMVRIWAFYSSCFLEQPKFIGCSPVPLFSGDLGGLCLGAIRVLGAKKTPRWYHNTIKYSDCIIR